MDGPLGQHVITDFYGVQEALLKDSELLSQCLVNAAKKCALTPVGSPVMQCFPGGGLTGFLVLSESHISLHTYPEWRFIGVDLFSCGKEDPKLAMEEFRTVLQPSHEEMSATARGTQIGKMTR